LRISEADYEYLLHTLSEARSRATEIAVSISARLGTDHRLAVLATGAALKVERVLHEVRKNAAGESDPKAKVYEMPTASVAAAPVRKPAIAETTASPQPWASFSAEAGVGPEHWLSSFVDDLMAQVRASGAIGFETAERLLQQRKDTFLQDLETTRRMYRNYPHLFREDLAESSGAPAQNGLKTLTAKV
jgi:hypothetical protein